MSNSNKRLNAYASYYDGSVTDNAQIQDQSDQKSQPSFEQNQLAGSESPENSTTGNNNAFKENQIISLNASTILQEVEEQENEEEKKSRHVKNRKKLRLST